MILLFTDFGTEGPYLGQMKAVLAREAPGVAAIDLMHDAPAFEAQAAAYLLAALAPEFPTGSVFLAVVDPGVGGARRAIALQAEGRWFVGPDNGLLAVAARRAAAPACWTVTWRPERLSASFHGRDLFAPVAARLARGEPIEAAGLAGEAIEAASLIGADWPEDLARVVYIDRFGNVMTGLRAGRLAGAAALLAGGRRIARARTFSDVAPGAAFWYENANGLAEIAVNQGRADEALGLSVGGAVDVEESRA